MSAKFQWNNKNRDAYASPFFSFNAYSDTEKNQGKKLLIFCKNRSIIKITIKNRGANSSCAERK